MKPVHGPQMCESCIGSGIEEGCEWSGESCCTCNGRGTVPCDCYECMPDEELPITDSESGSPK